MYYDEDVKQENRNAAKKGQLIMTEKDNTAKDTAVKDSGNNETLSKEDAYWKIRYEQKSFLFIIISMGIFHVALFLMAANYLRVTHMIKYEGYAEAVYTAFFIGIPFLIPIGSCLGLSVYYHKKAKENDQKRETR